MSAPLASRRGSSSSPILILGMHRSGTSYLASVVGAIGVNIGASLLEAAPDNPRGYFEDHDFVEFQAKVLTRALPDQGAGSPLGNILTRDIDRIELTAEEREHAARLTSSRDGPGFWGWKDPRTCLLLDFWVEQFPRATLIAVYRHPLEVYISLIKRQQLQVLVDEPLLIDSWANYNAAIARVWPRHQGQKFMIGTGVIFQDPTALAAMIREKLAFGSQLTHNLPVFESNEFTQLRIDSAVHQAFSAAFPHAGGVFDELQKIADVSIDLPPPEGHLWNELALRLSNQSEGSTSWSLSLIASLLSPTFGTAREKLLREGIGATHWAYQKVLELNEICSRATASATLDSKELTAWRALHLVESLDAASKTGAIYLWGKNSLGLSVYQLLTQRGIVVEGFVDANEEGAARPEELISLLESADTGTTPFVVVCSRSARDEICAILQAKGQEPNRDFVALPPDSWLT